MAFEKLKEEPLLHFFESLLFAFPLLSSQFERAVLMRIHWGEIDLRTKDTKDEG